MKKIGIGLVGLGTVGTGVARILLENAATLAARGGVWPELRAVCDKDLARPRPFTVPPALLADDWRPLAARPDIAIIVELVGGREPAHGLISEALARGKSIVTANKALLAEEGAALFRAARRHRCHFGFEAAVGGAIPVIRAISENFIADRFTSILAILNGTCNYILTAMTTAGFSLEEALDQAARRGYAERDPSLDLSGRDASHKICLLAALATGYFYPAADLHTEGITTLTREDIRYARELGYVIKLISQLRTLPPRRDARPERHLLATFPALVPVNHRLASISGVYNAIQLSGRLTGDNVLSGRGAGMDPTAASVVADIMHIADRLAHRAPPRLPRLRKPAGGGFPPDATNRFYLRFSALDKPGVFARIAAILGRHGIGIASCIQKEENPREAVPVVITTHLAREKSVAAALAEINRLPVVSRETTALRIMPGEQA